MKRAALLTGVWVLLWIVGIPAVRGGSGHSPTGSGDHGDADQALRLSHAGRPQLRRVLRHLPRRRRHPRRSLPTGGRPGSEPGLPPAESPRRPTTAGDPPRSGRRAGADRRWPHGRVRLGPPRHFGRGGVRDVALRRRTASLVLERRPPLRPVRPLLLLDRRLSRGRPPLLDDGEGRRRDAGSEAARGKPGRRHPDGVRPPAGGRHLVEGLRAGLRRRRWSGGGRRGHTRREQPGRAGPATRDAAVPEGPGPLESDRRPLRVLRRPPAGHASVGIVRGLVGRQQ